MHLEQVPTCLKPIKVPAHSCSLCKRPLLASTSRNMERLKTSKHDSSCQMQDSSTATTTTTTSTTVNHNCYSRLALLTPANMRRIVDSAAPARVRSRQVAALVVVNEDKLRRNKFCRQTGTFERSILGACSSLLLPVVTLLWFVVLFELSANLERTLGNCAKLPDIYWNSSNPIFRIDNTDHIFDVNKKQNDHDQVDLVCPAPGEHGNRTVDSAQQERYIIYSVSKEEYDTCRLNGPNGRVVAVCDQTSGKNRPPFTVTFRSFTPQPNGLEFKPGQDYYFISALPGAQYLSDPARRFSPCRELNMKVIFKVCCKGAPSPGASLFARAPNSTAVGGRNLQAPRRPAAVTIRPSLAPRPTASAAPAASLDELLRSLGGQAAQPQPLQQPQQPITVLPIEVLQQPTGPQEPMSSPSSVSTDSQSERESERNDIVQNEQPAGPRAAATPPERAPAANALRHYERWAPTPLPPALLGRPAAPAQRQFPASQPTGGEQAAALWLLPGGAAAPAPAARPAPFQVWAPQQAQHYQAQQFQHQHQHQHQHQPNQRGSHSRMSFYPHSLWSTVAYDQRMEQQQTPRDLITVQDAASSAANPLSPSLWWLQAMAFWITLASAALAARC